MMLSDEDAISVSQIHIGTSCHQQRDVMGRVSDMTA
jgi:hypothetical protein